MVGSTCGGVCTDQTDLANNKVVGEGFDKEGTKRKSYFYF